jgi:hypothetical protein
VSRYLVALRKGAALFTIILLGSTVQAQSIGIHFNNSGPGSGGPGAVKSVPMDPSEVAGVVPQANWNQVTGPSGFNQPLSDQNGVALATGFVSWDGSNTWTTGVPDAPGDSRLMGAYLDSNNTRTNTVVVTGISGLITSTYDLYVYCVGDGHGGRHGFYTLLTSGGNDAPLGGTQTLECTDFMAFDPGTGYLQDMQDGSGGNYIKFRGQSGDGFVLLASAYNPLTSADNGIRAPINAIQIVKNP